MVYSVSHDSNDDKRHHAGMMLRRNGGCLRFILIVAVLAFFLYGIFIYHDLQTRLKKSEDRVERYRQEHDSMSAQLQVVYEHKSRLEKSLQNEKAEHKKSKDDLFAQRQDIENKASSEKQELLDRISSINQEHKLLQSQHEDLQAEHTKLQEDSTLYQQERKLAQEHHLQEIAQMKQEKDLEIAKLRDQYTDLQKRQSELYHKLQAAITAQQQVQAQPAKKQQTQTQLLQQQTVNQKLDVQQQPAVQTALQQVQQTGSQQPAYQTGLTQQPVDMLLQQHPMGGLPQQPMGGLPQQPMGGLPQQAASQDKFSAGQIKNFTNENYKLSFSKTNSDQNEKISLQSENLSPNRMLSVHNAPDLNINHQQKAPQLHDRNVNSNHVKEESHLQLRPPVHNVRNMSQKNGDGPVHQVPAPQHHRDSRDVKREGDGQDPLPQIKTPGIVNLPQEAAAHQMRPPVMPENPAPRQQIGDVGKEEIAVDGVARGPVMGADGLSETDQQGKSHAGQIKASRIDESAPLDDNIPEDYPQGLAPKMSDYQAQDPQAFDAQKIDNGGIAAPNPLDQNAPAKHQTADLLQGQNNQPPMEQPEVSNLQNSHLQEQQQQMPPAADVNYPLQNPDKVTADDQQNVNYPKNDEIKPADGAPDNADNPDTDQINQPDDVLDSDKAKKEADQNERYQEDEEEDLTANHHDSP